MASKITVIYGAYVTGEGRLYGENSKGEGFIMPKKRFEATKLDKANLPEKLFCIVEERSIRPAKRDDQGKVMTDPTTGKILLEEEGKSTSRKDILKAFLTKAEVIEAFNSDDDLEFEAEANSARAIAARASSSNVSKEEMSTMNLEGAAV